MAIKMFPDFEHALKVGDRLIQELTVQKFNGRLAWVATNVVFSPAGAKGARPIIFFDDEEPAYIEETE